jgi:hypothetical protein
VSTCFSALATYMPYLSNFRQLGEFWIDYPGISRLINQPDTNGEFVLGLGPSSFE